MTFDKLKSRMGKENMAAGEHSRAWEVKSLGEIADVEYGFTEKSTVEGDYRYVRITDIDDNGKLISTDKKYLKYSKEAKSFLLQDNDLLMARTGATFAKVLLYEDVEPSVFASYLIRIKFKEKIENKLYWYFSKTKAYWDQANSLASGAAQPHFNGGAVKQVMFSYPKSLPEQQRIVSILDEAFAVIERSRNNAEQNLKNAKELFESYLKGVFENGNWEKKKWGELCDFVRGPFGGSLKKDVFKESGYVVYEQKHAIHDHFNQLRYFIDEEKFNEMKRFEVFPGDIIMSCSGVTLGRVAVVPDGIPKGIINQALLKLTPKKNVSVHFIKHWLRSNIFQKIIFDYSGGAAIPNVPSAKILKDIKIPCPNLKEQERIVNEIETVLIETQKLEAIYQQKLLNLDELKKSILQKAFAGELKTEKAVAV